MKLVKLSSLFDVSYGVSLELNRLTQVPTDHPKAINFVSRTRENNGVSAIVEKVDGIDPIPAGTISVAGSGNSVLYSFLQPKPYYSGYHLFYLTALDSNMTEEEKLFYCLCIFQNRFRFNYGRQANRTLSDLLVPQTPPTWVYNQKLPDFSHLSVPKNRSRLTLSSRKWKEFRYDFLFDIQKGERILNRDMEDGEVPCIRPISTNNGVHKFIDIEPNHSGNTITVNYNGSVGEAFYQPSNFFALDDVNVLYPKFELTPEIGMFLVTLIKREKLRFSYGRKWNLERMRESVIRLPVDYKGDPDWNFMQKYIESLPYSSGLGGEEEMGKPK